MTRFAIDGFGLTEMAAIHLPAVAALEGEIATAPWSAGMLAEELSLDGWRMVLLAPDRTVVGYGVGRWLHEELHLLILGVAPEFRRRGLGRGLVAALLDEARSRTGSEVLLEVRASNLPARQLYESLGFARIGLRRGYYRQGPFGPEDALVMACCGAR
ncbi:MAG: ribosomal protein S18-alanine N-acetyltransferase [Magnetococcales bacterium]|nr:ribosomal protein S18-alanine N-acetyltransferase [Magnetococcales bacterium]